jgi:hypothetical protein
MIRTTPAAVRFYPPYPACRPGSLPEAFRKSSSVTWGLTLLRAFVDGQGAWKAPACGGPCRGRRRCFTCGPSTSTAGGTSSSSTEPNLSKLGSMARLRQRDLRVTPQIESCCRLASLLGVPLVQAAQNVVPVAVTAGDKIEGLPLVRLASKAATSNSRIQPDRSRLVLLIIRPTRPTLAEVPLADPSFAIASSHRGSPRRFRLARCARASGHGEPT